MSLTKYGVAKLVSIFYEGPGPAWGKDVTGAPCILCTCGKWMRLKIEQVNSEGEIYLRHFEVWIGHDYIGPGCGENMRVKMVDFWRYNESNRPETR